jgi:hypothetical protein
LEKPEKEFEVEFEDKRHVLLVANQRFLFRSHTKGWNDGYIPSQRALQEGKSAR